MKSLDPLRAKKIFIRTYVKMIKNDAGVLLSSFILQIRANKKEQFFDTIKALSHLTGLR